MNINRLSALVCACTLSLSLLTGCGTQPADTTAGDGRLRVLTSFYPMYDFACKIGGDCIDVTNIVPLRHRAARLGAVHQRPQKPREGRRFHL